MITQFTFFSIHVLIDFDILIAFYFYYLLFKFLFNLFYLNKKILKKFIETSQILTPSREPFPGNLGGS